MPKSQPAHPVRVIPFLPILVVSVIHLGAIAFSLQELVVWTKPLLMPALALGLVWAAPHRRSPAILLGLVALFFSWAGDVTIHWFVIGLGCFLLAHAAYLVLFVGQLAVRRVQWWSITYVAWLVVLLVMLLPAAGPLAIPVTIYGITLCAMGVFASRCNGWVALGGALFIASDSILAIDRFLPQDGIPFSFLIMITYIGAQTLIVWGIVQHERARVMALAPALADPVRNSA